MKKIALLFLVSLLGGCSINQLTVRASMPMIEGGMQALYRESDLQLAEAAFAPNIELLEGMIVNDPSNQTLHEYAAQAYYGYAFGFVEDTQPARAAALYQRGLKHAQRALQLAGFGTSFTDSTLEEFSSEVDDMDEAAIAALFWASSNWAKWIDMNRDSVDAIGQLPKAVALMERVLALDENYFFASPHVFMGVYHGGRSPMLGGNFELAQQHFDKAREFTQQKMLIVNVMQAQYLERQKFDQEKFHALLQTVVAAPDDLNPDQALANELAKRKAKYLLEMEDQWF